MRDELMTLLRGLVGHGSIKITSDNDVHVSHEALEDVCDFLRKQTRSLEDRHELLWNCLLTDAGGKPLSKQEVDIVLTDCVFGHHNMRELLADYANRLIAQGYGEDLIKWYQGKRARA